jgi:hypothetical protein
MGQDEIPVDKNKLQAITKYLSSYMMGLPDFNSDKSVAEKVIIGMDNLFQGQTISAADRDYYNNLLKSLEVPLDLFL